MKTLLILRHAKSDHADPGLADHDRPLNERGKHDAPRVGERLLAAGLVPDAILSSTAKRAKKTAEKVAKSCGFQGKIEFLSDLYLAPPATYLDTLSRLDSPISRAMIVGHNPGLENLLSDLSGQYLPFPTAALAYLEFDIDSWEPLTSPIRGRLIELWLPRETIH